jgi:hypothetical protein
MNYLGVYFAVEAHKFWLGGSVCCCGACICSAATPNSGGQTYNDEDDTSSKLYIWLEVHCFASE